MSLWLRARLRVRSGLGTPLSAATLWGHMAWGYRYRHGESSFRDWLRSFEGGEPPLVLSEPMLAEHLPRPRLPPHRREFAEAGEFRRAKERSKRRQLPREWFVRMSAGEVDDEVIDRAIEQSLDGAKAKSAQSGKVSERGILATQHHAAINRLTGGTLQPGGGTLFMDEREWFNEASSERDLWIRSRADAATVEEWLRDGLAGGYGRNASSGSGHIVVEWVRAEAPMDPWQGANAVMALAEFVPAPSDPVIGAFDWSMRSGRLGGLFAVDATPAGSILRQKKPVLRLGAGSVLITDGRTPEQLGRILGDVHEDPCIREYGLSPCLPLRLKDRVVDAIRELSQ